MTTTEWTAWQGGECPVDPETLVEVRFANGQTDDRYPASFWNWWKGAKDWQWTIVGYRDLTPPAPPTAVQAAVDAEREKVAAFMLRNGFATGHGDTLEGLLGELEWQIAAIRARGNVEGK